MSKYYDAIKVVLCGESGVGKQEFMRCILLIGFPNINIGKMNSINTPFQKTIYYKKYKKTVCFNIWNTSGEEMYHAFAPIYYRGTRVCILLYNIANHENFKRLERFYREAKEYTENNDISKKKKFDIIIFYLVFALVGNNYEPNTSQVVSTEEAKSFAEKINAIFQIISTKDNIGINELFDNIGNKLFEQIEKEENERNHKINQILLKYVNY